MLEQTAKAAKTHLDNDLPAALDVVEAYWAAQGDAIALDDPVTKLYGHQPTVVERPRADFPITAVMAFDEDEDPLAVTDQGGIGTGLVPVIVHWFVDADSEEQCHKICQRYGEAIDAVMRDHPTLATGIKVASFVPQTRLSLVSRDKEAHSSVEFFTQQGQKTYRVRVAHHV